MNYIAIIKGKDGLITYPFAKRNNNLLIVGNKNQFILDESKINSDIINSNIINEIDKGTIILKSFEQNNLNDNINLSYNNIFDNLNLFDETKSRYVAKIFEISTNIMLDPNTSLNIFHNKTERSKKISEVINDLDAIKNYGIPILDELDNGFTLSNDKILDKPTDKLLYGLQVLSAIHKRGIIMGKINLINGKIDVMSAEFYAGTDNINNMYKYIGSNLILKKYINDTLRIFKLSTIVDVGSLCALLEPKWIIYDYIVEYINGDIKEWLSDIILLKFKEKYNIN
jgi:hypothetical protein